MIKLPAKTFVASFDVDAQKCFTPLCVEELPVPEGHYIAEELNLQAKFATLRVGSKDAHSPQAIWIANEQNPQLSPIEGVNVDVRWVPHAIPGTPGFELIPDLPHVTEYDFFVWKGIELDMHPYGACYHDLAAKMSTGVIEFLHSRGIKTIIVGGLALEYCVKTTVLQLRRAGFEVIVNLAACRGIDLPAMKEAEEIMQQHGVKLVASANYLEQE